MHTETLHLTHNDTYAHTLQRKPKKKKKEKVSPVSLQNHSLAAVAIFPVQTVIYGSFADITDYQAHSSKAEKHCCNFSAYCEPGRSPLQITEWGRKRMQSFFLFLFLRKKNLYV